LSPQISNFEFLFLKLNFFANRAFISQKYVVQFQSLYFFYPPQPIFGYFLGILVSFSHLYIFWFSSNNFLFFFCIFSISFFFCGDPKNCVTTKLNHCSTMNTRLTTEERMVRRLQRHHRWWSSTAKKSRIHYLKSVNASYSLYAPTTFIKIVSLLLKT